MNVPILLSEEMMNVPIYLVPGQQLRAVAVEVVD
jgi:hypothetical protein